MSKPQLSMEDKIAPRLSTDGAVHVYTPDSWLSLCMRPVEPVAGPMPEDIHSIMCEACVTATMIGLRLRQMGT